MGKLDLAGGQWTGFTHHLVMGALIDHAKAGLPLRPAPARAWQKLVVRLHNKKDSI